jgi:hypothetical protein
MDLSEALKNKKVTMNAVNLAGRYTGKTTKLTIKNISSEELHLKIDLGIFLLPDTPGFQPMVLAGGEMLVVKPSKEGDIMVNTFCGNALFSCPDVNLHYSFGYIGSDTLIRILRFIKTNSLFDFLGQNAVWAITDGHYIGSVFDADREALSKQFEDLICKITGRNKADYYTVNRVVEQPSKPAYIPKQLKIIADFEILLDAPNTLTLGVFDSSGKVIQPVFENQSFPRAGHRFGVEFESTDVPAGKYFILLKEADKILQQKMVRVD